MATSLEPTYEGLKVARKLSAVRTFYSLEPTYEGLKEGKRYSQRLHQRSLEPTYEGLKVMAPASVAKARK